MDVQGEKMKSLSWKMVGASFMLVAILVITHMVMVSIAGAQPLSQERQVPSVSVGHYDPIHTDQVTEVYVDVANFGDSETFTFQSRFWVSEILGDQQIVSVTPGVTLRSVSLAFFSPGGTTYWLEGNLEPRQRVELRISGRVMVDPGTYPLWRVATTFPGYPGTSPDMASTVDVLAPSQNP